MVGHPRRRDARGCDVECGSQTVVPEAGGEVLCEWETARRRRGGGGGSVEVAGEGEREK
jgi:hypothetical protein